MIELKPSWRGFASDNYAGVHPEILAAIGDVNSGHQIAYGDDEVSAQLTNVVQRHFGADAQAFGVFNGTGCQCCCAAKCLPSMGSRNLRGIGSY